MYLVSSKVHFKMNVCYMLNLRITITSHLGPDKVNEKFTDFFF